MLLDDITPFFTQVTIVADALKLAMTKSEDRAKIREQLKADLDEKSKKAIERQKKEAKEAEEASKPKYPSMQMTWIEKETVRPKKSGSELWSLARQMALARQKKKPPKSFMEQAKKMVFARAQDSKAVKIL